MDIEASIDDRLQKLKQWQVEQQEKLLKQQRIQREILSYEQDRIYRVLGLPTHNFDFENMEDTCVMHEIESNVKETMSDKASMLQCSMKNSDVLETISRRTSENVNSLCKNYNKQSDDSDHISAVVDKSRNSVENYISGVLSQKNELSDSLIEGIKPLSLNDITNRCASIDDIPLPLSKKDFQTILEEKLKKESEITPSIHTNMKIKPKKPFLKKGQGLSRFKMSTNLHQTVITKRCKKKKPLSSDIQHIDRSNKSKRSIVHSRVSPKTLDNVSVANENGQLSLKTILLPKKKIFNKSITPTNQITYNFISNRPKHLSEMNISDCHSKAEKELEEVRIFELLEEKAENSSFCSTSSTVLAFLQQSTPFKNSLNQMREDSSVVVSKKEQNDEQTNDMIKQESITQKAAHTRNLKSSIEPQVEQFEFYKHSHGNAATIDSWNTTAIDNILGETQNFISNQVLRSNKVCTNYLENHNTSIIVLPNSDAKNDISMKNECNLMHDSEANVSHHVRFSECNEYKTIGPTDISDMASYFPSKNYLVQQNWNDHSIDMSGSSDVKKLPINYEEQIHNSSLKIISNEKMVSKYPRQSSLQQDVIKRNQKDSDNHIMKTIYALEEDALNYKGELPNENTCYDDEFTPIEESVQTSDEERSILSSPLSSSLSLSLSDTQELSEGKEYVLRSELEKIQKMAKIYSNVKEADCYPSVERMNQTNTFETELLKNSLLELEKEIDIFRKESSTLLLQRRKLQEDEMILHKQYIEKEKNFDENKRRIQDQLEEEKKRIAREKMAMENRIRDAQEKARQNKMERQKAQNLREQLEQLKDELNIKESRWNAAESRYKSEFRVLRVEISKLKQEIANLQKIKRTNVKKLTKNTGKVITKAINHISKRIVVTPSKETSIKTCQDLSNTSAHDNDENQDKTRNKSIMKVISVNDDFGEIEDDIMHEVTYKQIEIESQSKCKQKFLEGNIVEKKYLYENLLKDAASDLIENQNLFHTKQNMLSDSQQIVMQIQNLNAKSNNKPYSNSTNKDLGYATAYVANNIDHYTNRSCEVNRDLDENDVRIEKDKKEDQILSLKKNLSSTLNPSSFHSQISKTSVDTVKQIHFLDGRIEYWYPNGNVKKIFPDQDVIKMIYYNGDVCETDKNRKIKYFYATTRTWHTTTPDGLEILEFSDGQVEKRMSDGTIEVLFPDGTIVQTFINGNKILTLPNGQKEIHTKAYKRREYPDGTVKIVYADGTQETCYSSGRKRLKDKHGNLLMDSYNV